MPLSLLMLSSQKDLHDKQPLHNNIIYYQISKEKISKKFRFYAICVNLFEGCCMCVCRDGVGGGGILGAIHHTVANLHILHGEKCAKIVFSA